MAEIDYKRDCTNYAPTNVFGTDADAITYLGGLAGDQTAAARASPIRAAITTATTTVDASHPSFDQTAFYGGGSCPSGTISFGAFVAHVPMTDVCTAITWIGRLLIGVTSFGCFFIYSKILGGN